MHTGMKAAIALVGTIAALAASGAAQAELYDLTFSNPPHTVGFEPVEGGGPAVRHTVSENVYGTPKVVSALGALTDQPCQFDSWDGVGDQVKLRLNDLPAQDFYSLEADVLVQSVAAADQFSIIFDAPATRRLDFNGDGTISQWVSGLNTVALGSYTVGQVVHLRVDVNLNSDQWTIVLDGTVVFTGDFGSASSITSIRFTTIVTGVPPGCLAAIDNVVVTEDTGSGACDRLTMGDLVTGTRYYPGDDFMTEGVAVSVSEHFSNVGACGAPLASGFCEVDTDGFACGAGRELNLNNVTLTFDFGGPVTDVVIPYGEYGGTVSLAINGSCQVVQNFFDLNNTVMGGVTITVFDFGVHGQSCGVIRLGGTVESLGLSGQEFYIDGLSYCHACPELKRSAFDDQTLGATFNVGQSFVSGAATHRMKPFSQTAADCAVTVSTGVATIGNGLLACGGGKELGLNNIIDRIDYGATLEWLALGYGEFGGNVNLRINGECANMANLADVNGTQLGGAKVWAVDYGTPGQCCGTLYVVGTITEFGIGGQELWIDNVRACLVGAGATDVTPSQLPGDLPSGLLGLAQSAPNPFSSRTHIRFELARPSSTRLTVHDVSGRLVRTLVEQSLASGPHDVAWDGKDEQGRRAPAGLYTYRVETAGMTLARTMVLLPR